MARTVTFSCVDVEFDTSGSPALRVNCCPTCTLFTPGGNAYRGRARRQPRVSAQLDSSSRAPGSRPCSGRGSVIAFATPLSFAPYALLASCCTPLMLPAPSTPKNRRVRLAARVYNRLSVIVKRRASAVQFALLRTAQREALVGRIAREDDLLRGGIVGCRNAGLQRVEARDEVADVVGVDHAGDGTGAGGALDVVGKRLERRRRRKSSGLAPQRNAAGGNRGSRARRCRSALATCQPCCWPSSSARSRCRWCSPRCSRARPEAALQP